MKTNLLTIIVIVVLALLVANANHGIYETKLSQKSSLLMQNIEALADNESDGKSTCGGIFGKCQFECTSCGYKYFAIGSTFENHHKCMQ